jgi:hypothetical protein
MLAYLRTHAAQRIKLHGEKELRSLSSALLKRINMKRSRSNLPGCPYNALRT